MSSLIRKATKYKEQAKFEVKALVAAEKYLEEEKQRLSCEQMNSLCSLKSDPGKMTLQES